MKKNEFYEWLKENTNLMESSIRTYFYAIEKFLKEVKELNIEEINKFISENFRNKRNYHYKYAIKKYLEFIKREDIIPKLVKVKISPRKKVGHYYDKETILKIIDGMNYYKIVALIQYITGARAKEVLSFNRNKLIKETNGIRLILEAKGGNETGVYIPNPYAEKVLQVIESRKKEYPFLKGSSNNFTTLLNNNYRYYLNELKKSVEKLGIEFNTHDFRRNFARMIYNISGKKISVVKAALRHSKFTSTERYIGELVSKEELDKLVENIFT